MFVKWATFHKCYKYFVRPKQSNHRHLKNGIHYRARRKLELTPASILVHVYCEVSDLNQSYLGEISVFHGGENEDDCLLGCCTV
jgi:hypothetical protein